MAGAPTGHEDLLAQLDGALAAAAAVDVADPAAARAALARAYPADGPAARALGAALQAAVADGRVCDRGEPSLRWSRLAKASPATRDFSIDLVWMSAPGPEHVHPRGEINLCWAVEGAPRFDGQPPGWVVFPPGSRHVPTVTGGRMLIAYFLPGGAMEFVKPAG